MGVAAGECRVGPKYIKLIYSSHYSYTTHLFCTLSLSSWCARSVLVFAVPSSSGNASRCCGCDSSPFVGARWMNWCANRESSTTESLVDGCMSVECCVECSSSSCSGFLVCCFLLSDSFLVRVAGSFVVTCSDLP